MSNEWIIILTILRYNESYNYRHNYKGQDQTHFRKVYIIHEMDKRIVS